MGTIRTLVAVNEDGRRIGETHHRARISDELVEAIRDRHEYDHWGYRRIAKAFGLRRSTVQKICGYERRIQRPITWKTVPITLKVRVNLFTQ
jgi:AraC-like DNA-binding protein